MSEPSVYTGLLVIDKPLSMTSMRVCRIVRRRLVNGGAPKKVKVGHGGTLDPLATGVLVVMVGRATKLCERVMAGEKRYAATIALDAFSTTDDREGVLTPICVMRPPTREEVESACARFVGEIEQTPPVHSAIWVNGRRAYDIAREGGTPNLQPRRVTIHRIDVIDYAYPKLSIDVRCGKGTYIRSLARDIGKAIGVGGMLDGLRRTAVGRFTIDRAVPIDNVPDPLGQQDLLDPSQYTE